MSFLDRIKKRYVLAGKTKEEHYEGFNIRLEEKPQGKVEIYFDDELVMVGHARDLDDALEQAKTLIDDGYVRSGTPQHLAANAK